MTNWPWTDLRLHLLNDIIKSKNNSLIITEYWKKTPADFISLKYQRTRKVGKFLKFSHATPTFFPRSPYDVKYSNNSKQLKSYLSGLAARAIYFFLDTKWPFSPSCRNWPIYVPRLVQMLVHHRVLVSLQDNCTECTWEFYIWEQDQNTNTNQFLEANKMWNILHFKPFSGKG